MSTKKERVEKAIEKLRERGHEASSYVGPDGRILVLIDKSITVTQDEVCKLAKNLTAQKSPRH
jgi:hypothetical protein